MQRRVPRKNAGRLLRPGVEGVESRILLSTFTVTNTNDDTGEGSLRWAIGQSNGMPGSNLIDFKIPGTGVQSIAITSALPKITVPVTIDGTTQDPTSTTPVIELNGSGAGGGFGNGVDGLDISAGNSTIKGLAINRFTGEGINLSAAGKNTIENNFIGTDPSGTVKEGNGQDGILVQVNSNQNSILDNVISGNGRNGVYLNGELFGASNPVTSGNIITGNFIGTDAAGTHIVGNGSAGVYVQNAPSTTIGGTTAATRNIISGNSSDGVELYDNSDSTVVEGNYVGTDVTGSLALGNGTFGSGIIFRGISFSTIGGNTPGAGNVLSGNNGYGIDCFVIGSSDLTIQGNFIGTDASGTKPLGNQSGGVHIWGPTNVLIGGTDPGDANVISGNKGDGITTFADGPGLTIQGNFIGTDLSGKLNLGNGGDGVHATYDGITIGGTAPGAGNVIANNGFVDAFDHSGVVVTGKNTPVLSNSIYGNKNLGIELDNGNHNQAAPVLTTADSFDGVGTFMGSLQGAVGQYVLQFFSNPSLSPSGQAEGKVLVGTATVTLSATSADFSVTLLSTFKPGDLITATATDASGNTSQFSSPIIATGVGIGSGPPTIEVDNPTPTVPSGQDVTYTYTITNHFPSDDQGVVFSFMFPTDLTFVSGTTSTDVPVTPERNGLVSASIGSLSSGQSVKVTLVFSTQGLKEEWITSIGGVTASYPHISSSEDTKTVTTHITPSADLAVVVTGPTDPVAVGQDLTYQVKVTNNGPLDATGVVLTDTLPANVTFVSANADTGASPTQASGTVTDAIGTLASGASVTVTIVVTPTTSAPPSITNTVKVSATQDDPNTSNNTATLDTDVFPVADVAIESETAAPTSVPINQQVTLTINVANHGPSAATGVTIVDTLPAGLTFVSGSIDGGTVTESDGVVTAHLDSLADGGTAILTILAKATAVGSLSDSAKVSSSVNDPSSGNNQSSASVTVTPVSDLSVSLKGPSGQVYTGDVLTYTAVVTNNGPSPATGVVFTDPLFAGATFQSAEANNISGTEADGVVTLPIGTLAAGDSVTVVLKVIATQPGAQTDTATVSANETDSDSSNNASSVVTTLILPPSLIEFTAATYTVREDAGVANILLERVGGEERDVTVHFSTVGGGNAVAGVDYQPASGTVHFAPGVTEISVSFPVHADPFDNHDELVRLQLDSPTGGAILQAGRPGGTAPTNATLRIVDIDPVLVGPKVTDVKLIGLVNSINAIELDVSGNLNPATATATANYSIIALGGGGKFGLPAGTHVGVASASYDGSGKVTLTPQFPLPSNEFFEVVVRGTGDGAVADRAGNLLNSTLGETPGSDYAITVARGNTLVYADENGSPVVLKLRGPGTLDIERAVDGHVQRLQVLGAFGRKTTISGAVHSALHRTTIGTILGLGQFGGVRVNLSTPPFYVTHPVYPNSQSLIDTPAEDVLIGGSVAAPVGIGSRAIASKSIHPRGPASF